MGGACCAACARGEQCSGAGCPIPTRAAGLAPRGPFQKATAQRAGASPRASASVAPRAKSAAGIADLHSETDAMGYYPTNAELAAMGLTRADWDRLDGLQRLAYAAGGGSGGGSSTGGGSGGSSSTVEIDDPEFLAELDRVEDPAARERLVREHMRQAGASEEQIRAGLFQLGTNGMRALTDYLTGDLRRDLAAIREAGETAREEARQRGLTARAEIDAAGRAAERDAQLRADERAREVAATSSSGNGPLYFMAGVAGLALLAAFMKSSGSK